MLEVKRLEPCSSGVVGKTCALASLSDIPVTTSLKCTVANIGDIITPVYISPIGTPYFSYEDYLKYAKGDHYERVYIEFQYEIRKIELRGDDYNTALGISEYIKDMKSLYEVIHARQMASKKGIELNSLYWRGYLFFDEFGQVMKVYKVEYKTTLKPWILKELEEQAVSDDYFRSCCNRWSITGVSLPSIGEKCSVCGEEWTIDNLSDYMVEHSDGAKDKGYHIDCFKQMNDQKQKEEFMKLFDDVYKLSEDAFTQIPNEYCDCDRCACWFKVRTPDGSIKLGWRKRVIEISWLDSYQKFRERFNNEDVTKELRKEVDEKELNADIKIKWGSGKHASTTSARKEVTGRYIHAWGTNKAKEYLLRAKKSIIKK